MFRINVPVIKSYEKGNGKLIVEGVASDPTIDREEERFDVAAIQKMLDGVNKGGIPIKCEHEDKFYSDIAMYCLDDPSPGYFDHLFPTQPGCFQFWLVDRFSASGKG